jgi:hypothetical protein
MMAIVPAAACKSMICNEIKGDRRVFRAQCQVEIVVILCCMVSSKIAVKGARGPEVRSYSIASKAGRGSGVRD